MTEPCVTVTYTVWGKGFVDTKQKAIAMLEAELEKLKNERRAAERRTGGRRGEL